MADQMSTDHANRTVTQLAIGTTPPPNAVTDPDAHHTKGITPPPSATTEPTTTHETRAPYIRFVTEQPERRVTIRSQSGNYRAQDSNWRREQQPRTHDISRGGERLTGFRTGTQRVIYRRGGA